MATPASILDLALRRAQTQFSSSFVTDPVIRERVEYVARNRQNRAGARLLLACSLAKVHNATLDIRKPYTEIGTSDSYSGRSYDEQFVEPFVFKHALPCNPTTAFLTPALRNRAIILTPNVDLVGRPKQVYEYCLQLFDDVYMGRVTANDLLAEVLRQLVLHRDEMREQLEVRVSRLQNPSQIPLSSEDITTLVKQHLASRRSSRLPVLVVAAAYQAAEEFLGERVLPLLGHNAADSQTGALGDLEIVLLADDSGVVTSYEMKTRRVTREDIDKALMKIDASSYLIDNYLFITTDIIDRDVADYAASIYDRTGTEIAILDCIGFIRHFLHLFHRLRMTFLDAYQKLLLAEPESAVRQELKEAFLALRQAAESGD